MEKEPLKTLRLDFTVLEFFDSYVISSLFDDQVLDQRHVDEMTGICLDFFGDNRFVYISNRRASYNVNPIIYINLNKARILVGIAVVSEDPGSINMANFEKQFSKLPFEVFVDMEDAQEWAEELVKNKKADL